MKRRAFALAGAAIVATTTILACSLRDTAYLQAGGGTSTEGGNDTGPVGDGSGPTRVTTVLTEGQVGPKLLAQDAESVYWVTVGGNVMAIKKDGSETAARVVTTAGDDITALGTADSATLFYTKDNQIFTVPKAGGAATLIATTPAPLAGLAVDSTSVFAIAGDDTADCYVYRVQHDGGAPTVLRSTADALTCIAIATHGSDVFWDEGNGTFFSLKKDAVADASPTAYASSDPEEYAANARAFAVDEGAFFFSDEINVLTRARTSSSRPGLTVIPEVAGPIQALTVDDQFVYALETGFNGSLLRNTKDATKRVEVMLTGLASPTSFVVDGDSVYITLEGPPGSIVKCQK